MRQCGGTPSLDGVCARRPRCAAGRDEETVPRSNKETDGKGRSCRACSGITLIPAGPSTASDPPRPLNPKRTNDVLRKPDNCKSYGQGRNVESEYRWAEDHYDQLPELATDLL